MLQRCPFKIVCSAMSGQWWAHQPGVWQGQLKRPARQKSMFHLLSIHTEAAAAAAAEAEDGGCLGAAEAAVWQVIMCFISWPIA